MNEKTQQNKQERQIININCETYTGKGNTKKMGSKQTV